jgi:hypothetical protein
MGRRAGTTGKRAAALVAAALALGARAGIADELEYRVKAEFIERFTHFIDWPPAAFASADAPFVICVVGATPLTPYLQDLAARRRIKDRAVEVRHVAPSDDLLGCHLVFLAADERRNLPGILARVAGRPIVTVADTAGFGRAGVLINLELDPDGRVGFEISSSGAKRSPLTVKAQLLKLSHLSPAGAP